LGHLPHLSLCHFIPLGLVSFNLYD
jgi:hypothetical protein